MVAYITENFNYRSLKSAARCKMLFTSFKSDTESEKCIDFICWKTKEFAWHTFAQKRTSDLQQQKVVTEYCSYNSLRLF